MSLNVKPEGQAATKNLMIAPHAELQAESQAARSPGTPLNYTVINDQGIPVNYATAFK
ncbi:hypothetical protein [Pantoea anthophila]|uniref:fimbrial biogenesis chaperone n=1 Tax=Pantoea anthophila TaxID=470931 RepID=UPI0027D7E075|nr:hypothetical protein [Pantoea anthophila]